MKILFRLAALGLGLLVAFVIVEIGLRAAGIGFGNSPMEPDPVLHHVHPRNYSFIQQHPSGELGGFEIQYDADGPRRPRRSRAEETNEAPTAVSR